MKTCTQEVLQLSETPTHSHMQLTLLLSMDSPAGGHIYPEPYLESVTSSNHWKCNSPSVHPRHNWASSMLKNHKRPTCPPSETGWTWSEQPCSNLRGQIPSVSEADSTTRFHHRLTGPIQRSGSQYHHSRKERDQNIKPPIQRGASQCHLWPALTTAKALTLPRNVERLRGYQCSLSQTKASI